MTYILYGFNSKANKKARIVFRAWLLLIFVHGDESLDDSIRSLGFDRGELRGVRDESQFYQEGSALRLPYESQAFPTVEDIGIDMPWPESRNVRELREELLSFGHGERVSIPVPYARSFCRRRSGVQVELERERFLHLEVSGVDPGDTLFEIKPFRYSDDRASRYSFLYDSVYDRFGDGVFVRSVAVGTVVLIDGFDPRQSAFDPIVSAVVARC